MTRRGRLDENLLGAINERILHEGQRDCGGGLSGRNHHGRGNGNLGGRERGQRDREVAGRSRSEHHGSDNPTRALVGLGGQLERQGTGRARGGDEDVIDDEAV